MRGIRAFVWLGVVFVALALGYFAYRFSLSVRSVKARRAGDRERADELNTKGRLLFLAVSGATTLLVLVWVAVLVATH